MWSGLHASRRGRLDVTRTKRPTRKTARSPRGLALAAALVVPASAPRSTPPPSASTRAARARLQPSELARRRARPYTHLRRLVLTLSLALTVLVPLLVARSAAELGAGAAARTPLWLGAPWTVRVAGLELLDPLAALTLLVTGGLGAAALLGVAPVLLLVAALGRFFCGWLCPYVPLLALSNALRATAARLGHPLPDRGARWPRRWGVVALGGALGASAVFGANLVALVYPPAIVLREATRLAVFGTLGPLAGVLAALFALDTFVARAAYCRVFCPGGALLRLVSFASPVHVARDAARCTRCTACDVVCNLGQSPMTDTTDGGCERCGRCVAVCPTGALAIVGHRRLVARGAEAA